MPGMSCEEVRQIWSAETAGQRPSSREAKLVTVHLEQCETCRVEAEALTLFRKDESSQPAPQLDDLAKRRWIDQTLNLASTREFTRADRAESGVSKSHNNSTWIFVTAATVLLTVGISWFVFHQSPSDTESNRVPVTASIARHGRLLLASGEITINGRDTAFGTSIESRNNITTGSGRAILDLSTGVTVLLAEQTSVSVEQLDTNAMELRINSGRVVTQVNPLRKGPPFYIATPAGRVRVTGTAFAVDVKHQSVSVDVFRGSVMLEESSGSQRSVKIGQSAVFGVDEVKPLSDESRLLARQTIETLDLLSSGDAGIIEIDSVPTGASVYVDENFLGTTPLIAALRPGPRSLDLNDSKHKSVRELLELVPNSRVSRVFEMDELSHMNLSDAGRPTKDRSAVASNSVRHTAKTVRTTPVELLARARVFRTKRQWKQAEAAYRQLVRRFPSSVEAGSSRVSLGNIQLEHLHRPASALRSFDSYLAGSSRGTLAQEAAFGRISALKTLGQRDREIKALEAFLTDFPNAIESNRARRRLTELKK
jgi:FecR protein/PEGA domain/Tetratricopeptide repeat